MNSDAVQQLLGQLSLEEKARLCSGKDFWHLHGIERLDLEPIMVTDGPHGMRKQAGESDHVGLNDSVKATCFPSASGLAASWNKALLYEVGTALGRECRSENVSVLLGPGINIKRHPLGGRNFEYFSEDPYLSGVMAREWINGVQAQNVGTSLKHFAVNNHEHCRMVVDAIVDERTLREIYLPAFEIAVKDSQPWTVMCAYNKLNGTYLAEHPRMLTSILEEEWQFQGLVVTDWGANNDRAEGVKAGQALEMPASGENGKNAILRAIESGSLSLAELDRSVAKVLRLIRDGQEAKRCNEKVDLDAHHVLARKVAEESCVLLKNDHHTLPLAQQQSIAVLGAMAVNTRYQGSGSSQINPYKLEQPLDALEHAFGSENIVYSEGYSARGELTEAQLNASLAAAEGADKVVLFAGLTPDYESEGFDRGHMSLPPQQLALIEALAPVHHKLIVVLQNGAPVAMPFANTVAAILEAYLGGQAGASALARVLKGDVNPSGKLAETFPLAQADVASDTWFPGSSRQSQYRENIWVGYRYFDTVEKPVAFPFGHGLSYTQFEYSDIQVSGTDAKVGDACFSMKAKDTVTVHLKVTNVGPVAGAEIAQLYVGQLAPNVPRPAKELKAFDKVYLEPGESKSLSFALYARDFSYWSTTTNDWLADSGEYTIFVGASVADIRLQKSVRLDTGVHSPGGQASANCRPAPDQFTDEAFAELLGHAIPEPIRRDPIHTNSMISEIQHKWLGRQVLKLINKQIGKLVGDSVTEENTLMLEAIVREMPLRNLAMMSQGKLSSKNVHRLVHLLNGHYVKLVTGAPAESR
ncbi:glycosyl hydrolase [Halioglobus maricola]|uniref:Beta-D-glucoside glucohydrolase n=1 Tax=Halioglobus maricola TaxID=2601894 RepID=A0A5P9NJP7_9GAMM|nr:glycoside hydrolase family 3 C-terminal domain-containing protein [Halioglobus maricola]QFU75755.1 glycosyl hydrolase [Halioglobus maricola]